LIIELPQEQFLDIARSDCGGIGQRIKPLLAGQAVDHCQVPGDYLLI